VTPANKSRLLMLTLVGDRFVVNDDRNDPVDDIVVDTGLVSYLSRRCELRDAQVQYGHSRFDSAVYVSRSDPTTAYLAIAEDDDREPERRSQKLSSGLTAYAGWLQERLRKYDHEHAISERDLFHSFVRPNLSLRGKGSEATHTVDWERLQDIHHVVVLGAPGAGKTSLLRRVAVERADAMVETGSRIVPLYFALRSASEHDLSERGLRDLLCAHDPRANFDQLASSGEILLLFDGLDEVLDTHRGRIAQAIQHLTLTYPRLRIMVSSRSVSYKSELSDFATVDVLPFSQSQIHEWVWLNEPNPHVWTEFLTQVDQNAQVADMVSNPLLLSIAFYMFRSEAIVPRERASLFAYFVRALCEDWDRTRGIQRSALWRNPRSLFAYVCRLSYDLGERNEETFDAADALRHRPSFFGSTDPEVALQALAEKSGLIEQDLPGQWRFTHTALRDFLAGEYLVSSAVDASELIRDHLGTPRGRSVWTLACGAALEADPLVRLQMHTADELSGKDAALLVDALRQDLEVLEDVTVDAAALISVVLERELSGAVVATRAGGPVDNAHLERGLLDIMLRTEHTDAVAWLVVAILGARGAAFANVLRRRLLESALAPVRAIGVLLDTPQPLTAEFCGNGDDRLLRIRFEQPSGLPVGYPQRKR